MRVGIIGRTAVLYHTAVLLRNQGHEISFIITAKEAPEYKKTSKDFMRLAHDWEIPFLHTAQIAQAQNLIQNSGPVDIGVSINYSGIIPATIISLFRHGILNAHGGDLPNYRGNACQAWAIINGEDHVGLCIHRMVGGKLDQGDIIIKELLNIDDKTKIENIYTWMEQRIPNLFKQALSLIDDDPNYCHEKQNINHSSGFRCYPRQPSDARINFSKNNVEIIRLVNASGPPYSGAYCYYNNEMIYIMEAELYKDFEKYYAVPGQVSKIDYNDGAIIVITGKGKVKITQIKYKNNILIPTEVIKSIRVRLE